VITKPNKFKEHETLMFQVSIHFDFCSVLAI